MDLSKLDTVAAADEGADLELVNPLTEEVIKDEATGEPVTIRLVGTDSKDFMALSHKLQEKRFNKRVKKKGKTEISIEEINADSLELLIGCTKGWKHIVVDGQPLTYSQENARKLYNRFPWIKEQVDAFINDRANFLGES